MDVAVKVKLLKNVRTALACVIIGTCGSDVVSHRGPRYDNRVDLATELGERGTLHVSVPNEQEAENLAVSLVIEGKIGLNGYRCKELTVSKWNFIPVSSLTNLSLFFMRSSTGECTFIN